MTVIKGKQKIQPVWTLQDGISYSALSTWLNCREQFRLKYVCGWTSKRFSLPLEFGSAFHHLLETFPGLTKTGKVKSTGSQDLQDHEERKKYLWVLENWTAWQLSHYSRKTFPPARRKQLIPPDVQAMKTCFGMVQRIFPHYVRFHQKADSQIKWQQREQVFRVPVETDEGVIDLTGMIDGVFTRGRSKLPRLFETKTKGRVEEDDIKKLLHADMQTMTYACGLYLLTGKEPPEVCYNVIKRPSIQMRKNERLQDYLDRMEFEGTASCPAVEDNPSHYFMRWRIDLPKGEVERWLERHLRPTLAQFLYWLRGWGAVDPCAETLSEIAANDPWSNPRHYMNPGGLYIRNMKSEMFEAITQNNYGALYRRKVAHPELV